MRVDVETVSELSAGQTVCDVWHQSSKPKNVNVAQVTQHPLISGFCCFVFCLECCCMEVVCGGNGSRLSIALNSDSESPY